jgi:hypothetical protein
MADRRGGVDDRAALIAHRVAFIAVETGSSLYLRRFTDDSVDNLLARKHPTQVRILKRALHTLSSW